jgi:hypothetical protein
MDRIALFPTTAAILDIMTAMDSKMAAVVGNKAI